MSRAYYELVKPGIIYGNLLAAAAGFFVAADGVVNWQRLIAMLVGLGAIVACGAVLNNVLDRDIDAHMERTKNRALLRGAISVSEAVMFATLLGLIGTLILYFFTTPLALASALAGGVIYVALYTPLKPRTPFALFVGAVAGALPPVVGYTSVTNALDVYAYVLFGLLFLWQLPHFLAIATYRYAEYRAAGVPLFITREPNDSTKRMARKVFRYSLVVLLVACLVPIIHTWIR